VKRSSNHHLSFPFRFNMDKAKSQTQKDAESERDSRNHAQYSVTIPDECTGKTEN
jgi:hypothetical protein